MQLVLKEVVVVVVVEGLVSRLLEVVCPSRCSRTFQSATSMANVLSGPWVQLLPVQQLPAL